MLMMLDVMSAATRMEDIELDDWMKVSTHECYEGRNGRAAMKCRQTDGATVAADRNYSTCDTMAALHALRSELLHTVDFEMPNLCRNALNLRRLVGLSIVKAHENNTARFIAWLKYHCHCPRAILLIRFCTLILLQSFRKCGTVLS